MFVILSSVTETESKFIKNDQFFNTLSQAYSLYEPHLHCQRVFILRLSGSISRP
jgi:hypothetical protein